MAKAAAKPKAAAYTRKRVALAVEHVERGEDLIEQGRVPGRGIEFADTRTAGLILRVTPTASTFMLKTEKATIRLGEANRITVEQARDQAALAKISLKRGRDPRRQVAAFEASMGQTADVTVSAEAAAAVDDTPAQAFFARLNGTKHLVRGNHDAKRVLDLGWASQHDLVQVTVDGQRLVLCHYAMRSWPQVWRGAIHLYGHTHATLPPTRQSCDVGVDAWA